MQKHFAQIHEFKSFAQAERDIDEWTKTFPERYDVVIGIPRSGLYVASYIAIKLGIPLSTPDNFLRGEVWYTNECQKPSIRKALLVDDGIGRINGQMSSNFYRLSKAFPNIAITKAALYGYPDVTRAVDLCFGFLHSERLNREEWNIMHRKIGVSASDMDGVLCHDWNPLRYKSYSDFIENVEPYLIPRFRIDYIITSREEKYREATLKWLLRNEVNFGELLMMKTPNSKVGSVEHKSRCLKKVKATWYWESNEDEAIEIFRKTGIPILSIESMRLWTEETLNSLRTRSEENYIVVQSPLLARGN